MFLTISPQAIKESDPIKLKKPPLRNIRKLGFQVILEKKPVNFGPQQRITVIRPREVTTYKRDIYKACSTKNSPIPGDKRDSLDLSLGKQMIMKSPSINRETFHQLINPTNSSQSTLLSLSTLGPYTPTKAHAKLSSTFLKEQAT